MSSCQLTQASLAVRVSVMISFYRHQSVTQEIKQDHMQHVYLRGANFHYIS